LNSPQHQKKRANIRGPNPFPPRGPPIYAPTKPMGKAEVIKLRNEKKKIPQEKKGLPPGYPGKFPKSLPKRGETQSGVLIKKNFPCW